MACLQLCPSYYPRALLAMAMHVTTGSTTKTSLFVAERDRTAIVSITPPARSVIPQLSGLAVAGEVDESLECMQRVVAVLCRGFFFFLGMLLCKLRLTEVSLSAIATAT